MLGPSSEDVNGHLTDTDMGLEHGSEEKAQVGSGARSEKEALSVKGVAVKSGVDVKVDIQDK